MRTQRINGFPLIPVKIYLLTLVRVDGSVGFCYFGTRNPFDLPVLETLHIRFEILLDVFAAPSAILLFLDMMHCPLSNIAWNSGNVLRVLLYQKVQPIPHGWARHLLAQQVIDQSPFG